MKKTAFLSALALCLGFVSCDNYEEPNPPAQSNPQEAIFEANGLVLTPQTETLNLDQINNAAQNAKLGSFTVKNVPTGYTVDMVMQISRDENFSNAVDIPTAPIELTGEGADKEGIISIAPDALQAALNANITKDPAPITLNARFAAYIVKGSSRTRIGDENFFYGPEKLNIVPLIPLTIIENNYYFVYSKDGVSWGTLESNSIKFTHSNKSPYDDPKFSFTFDFPVDMVKDGLYWCILPESAAIKGWTRNQAFAPGIGQSVDENGRLMLDTNPGQLYIDGMVLFTINMEARTFEYIQAIPGFATPGGANGWSNDKLTMFTNDYTNYFGLVPLSGEFKFNPDNGWNGRDFGAGDPFKYEEKDGIYTGGGMATGGNNIVVPAPGLYYITLNYPTRETKMTQIGTIGSIGDFNGWAGSVAMTPDESFTKWTVSQELKKGQGWKFRMNNGWDINLGGNLQNLTFGGDNITCTEDGTYNITLDLSIYPYSAQVVKK